MITSKCTQVRDLTSAVFVGLALHRLATEKDTKQLTCATDIIIKRKRSSMERFLR
jgi:hypothetical protein